MDEDQIQEMERMRMIEEEDAIDLNNFDVDEGATDLEERLVVADSARLIHEEASRQKLRRFEPYSRVVFPSENRARKE